MKMCKTYAVNMSVAANAEMKCLRCKKRIYARELRTKICVVEE